MNRISSIVGNSASSLCLSPPLPAVSFSIQVSPVSYHRKIKQITISTLTLNFEVAPSGLICWCYYRLRPWSVHRSTIGIVLNLVKNAGWLLGRFGLFCCALGAWNRWLVLVRYRFKSGHLEQVEIGTKWKKFSARYLISVPKDGKRGEPVGSCNLLAPSESSWPK